MGKSFKEKLLDGEKLVGGVLSTPAYDMAEGLAVMGTDFALIEGEYGLLNTRETVRLVRALEAHGCSKIASVPEAGKVCVEAVLNLGIEGIIIPGVKNGPEAAQAVALTKFAPQGIRSAFPYVRANKFGKVAPADYFKAANENVAIGLRIGYLDVLKNIAEIAAVDGVDFIDINPFDLSLSMGKGGVLDEDVYEAITVAAETVHTAGKKIGTFTCDIAKAKELLKFSLDYISYGTVDSLVLADLNKNLPYIMEGYWS